MSSFLAILIFFWTFPVISMCLRLFMKQLQPQSVIKSETLQKYREINGKLTGTLSEISSFKQLNWIDLNYKTHLPRRLPWKPEQMDKIMTQVKTWHQRLSNDEN